MRVLSVASECAPLVKTGGLADVVGALPAALAGEGVEMRVMLPGYPAVMTAIGDAERVHEEAELFGGAARLLSAKVAGLDLLVLDAPHLYDRRGAIYLGPDGMDWPDNPQRFAALGLMAARIARVAGGWRPDLLHCHDWQAGLAPYYARGAVPSVMTVHNIAFQGLAPATMLTELQIDSAEFHAGSVEYYGHISALKAGLVMADKVTTVSPTYSRELTTPAFGMGLDGVIRQRGADVRGILNGIDLEVWDPANDAHAPNFKDASGKAEARKALEAELDLPAGDGPLAVVISRLTEQKGLDLLLEALPGFLDAGGRLALLGSGDAGLEQGFRLAAQDPRVAVKIGYDEALSHRMIAGGDAILVPSRFEPCGLTQLYGLRYGTIPVVALTGGLADTVIPANDAALKAGVATGVQFYPVTADALGAALQDLVTLGADRAIWGRMVANAMRHPVGWEVSAAEYAALYRSLMPDA